MESVTARPKIEPTLMIVLLLCRQVCDTIIQSIIEDGEAEELIAPFKQELVQSLMNQDLHFISQSLVIANHGDMLQAAIANTMNRIKGLMLQIGSTIIPVTDKQIEGSTDEN